MLKMKKNNNGLTFIELIAVIAIFNILLLIGKPTYLYYIQNKHADNVKLQMFDIVTDMERIKNRYYSYQSSIDSSGILISNPELMSYPIKETNKRFNITISDLTTTTFKIVATPTSTQGSDYGKISLELNNGEMKGFYDNENNDNYSTRWY